MTLRASAPMTPVHFNLLFPIALFATAHSTLSEFSD
jgi:hypothetical protein